MDEMIEIKAEDLLRETAKFKAEGCRMVQILCTRVPEGYEMTYSFDRDCHLCNLRLIVPLDGSVMSVTRQYWYAFVWENEIHDLFGLNIEFIAPEVDYAGNFFHLATEAPWHYLKGEKAAAAKKAEKAPAEKGVPVNIKRGLGVDATAIHLDAAKKEAANKEDAAKKGAENKGTANKEAAPEKAPKADNEAMAKKIAEIRAKAAAMRAKAANNSTDKGSESHE